MEEELICPWCHRPVRIQVVDDEGNWHPEEYEDDPWSGLGYVLVHTESDDCFCPIATADDYESILGNAIYNSREEAIKCWKGMNKNAKSNRFNWRVCKREVNS